MTELAIAAFAASTDAHLVDAPRSARFASFRATFDDAGFLRALDDRGYRWLARTDPAFPERLRSIHDPPAGLFVRGTESLDLLGRPSVAVVGARACSPYGASVAQTLGRDLAAAGVVVISGLARGIDAQAHRGALECGATVAVLGCGIDRDYPRSHASLAEQIASSGLIVSEYPPGVEPAPWRFPARNRIVSGLALATVVIEARERSGALITADLALDEGRDVLAVPGEITSQLSRGTNHLLRLGAVPVTCTADVLRVVGIDPATPRDLTACDLTACDLTACDLTACDPPPLEPSLEAVRAVVADAATTADDVAHATGQNVRAVAAALVELELLGVVEEVEGVYRTTLDRGGGTVGSRS